jgi:hypothetical protein
LNWILNELTLENAFYRKLSQRCYKAYRCRWPTLPSRPQKTLTVGESSYQPLALSNAESISSTFICSYMRRSKILSTFTKRKAWYRMKRALFSVQVQITGRARAASVLFITPCLCLLPNILSAHRFPTSLLRAFRLTWFNLSFRIVWV